MHVLHTQSPLYYFRTDINRNQISKRSPDKIFISFLLKKEIKHTDTQSYHIVTLYYRSLIFPPNFAVYVFMTFFFSFALPGSVSSHWLSHAAPKTSLPNCCHDLSLSVLEHSYNFSKRWPNIRVGIPASCHDLAENR